MSIVKKLGAAAAVVALMGCSYVPMRTPSMGEDTAKQQYWQSASHWKNFAHHIAGQVRTIQGKGDKIYIERLDDRSPFGGAFHDSMITAFNKAGFRVAHERRKGTMRLHYKLRSIRHVDTDYWPAKGTLTAMALGATTVYYLGETIVWPSIVAAALFTEIFEIPWPEVVDGPMSEVQITWSLMDGDQVIKRDTNIYYVDSQQIHQYAGALPAGPLYVRTGGHSNNPPSSRSFSVQPEHR